MIFKSINQSKESDRRARERSALIADINSVKSDIDTAQRNFDCVSKPDEVDIYIYRLRAAQARYDALLKKLKDLN